ncbi:tRNA (adenosine(37)-N6)-threonylcarbamoyltransferase complex ATPase subunit type 1 TsaE [Vallitalea okinawensis]|uniref:tRNA (adenosine(37)-N6)-threonylcarbamoyltransferase complex ATPase subunit type 1 TsaE n=1 Tax=Vallitalea okinawensis TaxID=2078660 RepID=UPI000CFA9A74|nr:tRNA (adenosine(37)-N6)-threonylcarbamoyltransferase complex ATPase subunit type 1 TsaE [Vallitalea okinawensis]
MIMESYSPEETYNIALELGQKTEKGQVYCLVGDLGVGKTIFTKGFAKGLGIDEHITSPTFTIVNEYDGDIPFYHFDVYRIADIEEMYEIGFEEYIGGNGIVLIEWANLIEELLPVDCKWIKIEKDLEKGLDYRRVAIVDNREEI